MSQYTTYSVHTDHSLDTRSWIISLQQQGNPSRHELDILYSSSRRIDPDTDEIVERVAARHGSSFCEIHMPIKGWYLLITSPSRSFRKAQKQATSPTTPPKSYVNLIPSRTHPSTEFKFTLVHASTSTSSSSSSAKQGRKRASHVIIDTDTDMPPTSSPSHAQKGWTTFDKATPSNTPTSSSNGNLANPFPEPTIPHSTSQIQYRTSTFLLRPIDHSIAKSHVTSSHSHHVLGHGHTSNSSANASNGMPLGGKHEHTKGEKRMPALRNLAGLFSATDNSFELIWQDDEANTSIPILIFEDHPSMLRTETSGQFHLLTSIIMNEFQMSSSPRESGGQGTGMIERKEENNIVGDDALYDPIGFFIAVGIAYLGFLEDQEAYKAASQG